MKKINKTHMANTEEIILRIIRAICKMQLKSPVVSCNEDKASLVVQYAEEACCAVPSPAYGCREKTNIPQAVSTSVAHAVHPNCRFFAENAFFAEEVRRNNMIFTVRHFR